MRYVKYALMGLGGLVAFVLLAFFTHAALVMFTVSQSDLDASSKAWVDNTAPQILTHWDATTTESYAGKLWKLAATPADTSATMDAARKEFGTMTKYGTSTGEAGIHIHNFSSTITAEYIVEADFTEGHARVFVQGIQEDGEWKLLSLYVSRDPSLRWEGSQLTTQPPLTQPGESQDLGGVHTVRLWNW